MNADDFTSTKLGTPFYMAPEIMNKEPYNHKIDIWSIGIIYFELLTGRTPFMA
jgi:serine/threonine protein kinase